MPDASRDNNRVPTLLGVDSVDGDTPRNLEVDESTGRLLVNSTGTVTIEPNVGTPTESAISVATSDTSVFAANSSRKYLQLVNDSDTTIYVSIDGGAAAVNTGTRLNANGGSAVWDTFVPTTAIRAIHGGTGTKTLLAVET